MMVLRCTTWGDEMLKSGIVALAALAACGGSSSGGMTIRGVSFSAAETISGAATQAGTGAAQIILSDRTGSCALATSNTRPKSSHGMVIILSDTAAIAAGTFTVSTSGGASKAATVDFVSLDATRTDVSAQEASGKSGTVTVTSVSGNALSGSFDVTFDSGDHVTGSFTGAGCAALVTPPSGSPSCG